MAEEASDFRRGPDALALIAKGRDASTGQITSRACESDCLALVYAITVHTGGADQHVAFVQGNHAGRGGDAIPELRRSTYANLVGRPNAPERPGPTRPIGIMRLREHSNDARGQGILVA